MGLLLIIAVLIAFAFLAVPIKVWKKLWTAFENFDKPYKCYAGPRVDRQKRSAETTGNNYPDDLKLRISHL